MQVAEGTQVAVGMHVVRHVAESMQVVVGTQVEVVLGTHVVGLEVPVGTQAAVDS